MRKDNLFSLLQVGYWGFYACYLNYAVTFFLEQGNSSGLISNLISGYLLMAFLGAFVWGEISDRFHTNRKTLLVQTALSALLCVLLFLFARKPAALFVLYPLLGFTVLPIGGNIDSWTLLAFHEDSAKYGRMRAAGSCIYAFAVLIFGWLIRTFGFYMMLAGTALFLGILFLTALFLPEKRPDTKTEGEKFSLKDVKDLFRSADYRRMIRIIFLIGLAVMPLNNLKILVIENVHGDVGNLGMDAFFGVLVQAPLIAMAASWKKASVRLLILTAACAQFCTLLVTGLAGNVWMVYVGTCCTNVGYGILLPTVRRNVEQSVDPRLRNLGHMVSDAVYASLSGVISTPVAGMLVEHAGVRPMLFLFAAFLLLPVLLGIVWVLQGIRQSPDTRRP